MRERTSLSEVLVLAHADFSVGHNCAQSVLGALRTYYGLPNGDLWRAAIGFGSGMGRRQLVCGAVSGGIMALGLVTANQRGSGHEDPAALREEVYARVRELTGRFEAGFGAVDCRTLLGCDLLTPEGQEYFGQNELIDRVCHRAVGFVVENAIGILGPNLDSSGLEASMCETNREAAPSPLRVLILCTGNSARSQMAEGWLRHLGGDGFVAASAGTKPAERVNPLAVEAMSEVGINIAEHLPKHLERFVCEPWDYVFTVCDNANESCPIFPGAGRRMHRSFDDPAAAAGTTEERLAEFRRVRDEIRDWLGAFVAEARATGG